MRAEASCSCRAGGWDGHRESASLDPAGTSPAARAWALKTPEQTDNGRKPQKSPRPTKKDALITGHRRTPAPMSWAWFGRGGAATGRRRADWWVGPCLENDVGERQSMSNNFASCRACTAALPSQQALTLCFHRPLPPTPQNLRVCRTASRRRPRETGR